MKLFQKKKTEAWVNIYEGEPMEIFSDRMNAYRAVRDDVLYRGTHHLVWKEGKFLEYGEIVDLTKNQRSMSA